MCISSKNFLDSSLYNENDVFSINVKLSLGNTYEISSIVFPNAFEFYSPTKKGKFNIWADLFIIFATSITEFIPYIIFLKRAYKST